MMLANPQKSAINGNAMVVPEGLDRVKRFKSLVCLTSPTSRTGMRGVPSQVSNLARAEMSFEKHPANSPVGDHGFSQEDIWHEMRAIGGDERQAIYSLIEADKRLDD
jgi:hypothetical protein